MAEARKKIGDNNTISLNHSNTSKMKKTFFSASLFFFSTVAFAGEPDAKVLTAFQRQFPNAADVRWFGEGTTSSAYFIQDGITHNLSYDNKGNLLSCARYYGERYLPASVKAALQRQFSGLSIYGVTEMTVDGETFYEIQLQNMRKLVTVQANNYGDAVEVARYKRADGTTASYSALR
jgi:hypothetical protein